VGKLLVSVSEAIESKLRQLADKEYAGKRGAISIIVEKALESYFNQKHEREALERVRGIEE